MNISRIISITPNGTWQSPHGLIYQLIVEFEDGQQGQANAKSQTPPYRVGDEVGYEFNGTYPGGQKVKIHKDPLGNPAGATARQSAATRQPAARAANSQGGAGQDSPSGALGPQNGQTVGMAMKEALALLSKDLKHDELVERLISPSFWASVHEVASDVIRVSLLLEVGKLALPIKDRVGDYRAAAPKTAAKPAQVQEDVPY